MNKIQTLSSAVGAAYSSMQKSSGTDFSVTIHIAPMGLMESIRIFCQASLALNSAERRGFWNLSIAFLVKGQSIDKFQPDVVVMQTGGSSAWEA